MGQQYRKTNGIFRLCRRRRQFRLVLSKKNDQVVIRDMRRFLKSHIDEIKKHKSELSDAEEAFASHSIDGMIEK